ncbi:MULTISPECIES: urease accessory protein UreE [Lactococcus]|uniref:urease accessory protein UreE n=1 Tax=Lactococcus TaxID=1357 RepID=UPI00117A23FA|nr:urease accessory protein UreE [Lactococcus lactis]TRW74417.1 urease accessory protein UreE [Lactococcus lactis]
MILTEVYKNVDDITDLDAFHIETALVKSDDLLKKVLRVTTDHENNYGIHLEDETATLRNGSALKISDKELLVLSVIADEMIVVTPTDINNMGELAHMLGNLHKPVQVTNGQISLFFDKVVAQILDSKNIPYEIKKVQLSEPLRYADLTF